jgi:antibiotic biosynthesis monooxygenase (ABM) superfamily enzyme
MSARETFIQIVLVWLAVYPSVLFFSYCFRWLGLDVPLYVEILVSTALTVPLITFVVQPVIQWRIARARGQSKADLLREQAAQKEESE